MNDQALAALLTAVLAGLGGLTVPRLVASIPEPAPKPEAGAEEGVADGATVEAPASGEPVVVAPPKETYAHIAALPGLGRRSALASALVGALIGAAVGLEWSLLWLVPLVPVSVALSVVDWRTRLLPRLVVLPATLLAVVAVVAVGLATDDTGSLVRALVAMLVVRSFFWVLWAIHSAGMGFGDVRLAAIVGLVLGWVGWGALAIGVWVGFIAFALPGLGLALVRRDRSLLRKPFPYGPFMLAGALVGLVWGPALATRLWG